MHITWYKEHQISSFLKKVDVLIVLFLSIKFIKHKEIQNLEYKSIHERHDFHTYYTNNFYRLSIIKSAVNPFQYSLKNL